MSYEGYLWLWEPFRNLLLPFFGTWFGARLAFKYDKNLKIEEREDKEIELAKYVQFVVISHIHIVKNTWIQYLQPHEQNTVNRHLLLKRYDFITSPSVDFSRLSFMADKDWLSILYDLFLHERKFLNFIDSLNKRSEFYNKYWEEIPDSKEKQEFIKSLTDNIYDSYLPIEKSNQEFFSRFRVYLDKKYPKQKFLSIE